MILDRTIKNSRKKLISFLSVIFLFVPVIFLFIHEFSTILFILRTELHWCDIEFYKYFFQKIRWPMPRPRLLLSFCRTGSKLPTFAGGVQCSHARRADHSQLPCWTSAPYLVGEETRLHCMRLCVTTALSSGARWGRFCCGCTFDGHLILIRHKKNWLNERRSKIIIWSGNLII